MSSGLYNASCYRNLYMENDKYFEDIQPSRV